MAADLSHLLVVSCVLMPVLIFVFRSHEIYCVKVDDFLTVNDRESSGGGGEPESNNLVHEKA